MKDRPLKNIRSVSPEIYDQKYFKETYGADCFFKNEVAQKFKYTLKVSGFVPKDDLVLDIGCGRGDLTLALASNGARVVGLDYSESALEFARQASKNLHENLKNNISLVKSDAVRLPFPDGQFNLVFMVDIVEHLYPEQLHECFNECCRILKSGGRLIVHTSPNKWYNDIAYPFWERPINRVINKLFRQNLLTRHPIRTEMDLKVHVNEQTVPSLKKYLTRVGFVSKIWLGDEYLMPHKKETFLMQVLELCRQIACHLFPLSLVPPLSYLFSNNIWVIARKPG